VKENSLSYVYRRQQNYNTMLKSEGYRSLVAICIIDLCVKELHTLLNSIKWDTVIFNGLRNVTATWKDINNFMTCRFIIEYFAWQKRIARLWKFSVCMDKLWLPVFFDTRKMNVQIFSYVPMQYFLLNNIWDSTLQIYTYLMSVYLWIR